MHEIAQKDHARIETRRTAVSTELDWLVQKDKWHGLQTVATMLTAPKGLFFGRYPHHSPYCLKLSGIYCCCIAYTTMPFKRKG